MAVLVSCEEISPSTLSFPRTLHAESTSALCSSGPTRSLSLDTGWEDQDDEDQILFPPYDAIIYHGQVENLEPPSRLWTGDSNTVSSTSTSISANVLRPESPVPVGYAEDDTAARIQPSNHVDYLSHNWKEEDIWSSWKHIVSKRIAYSNSARLENASWRTWMKSKNKLETVSPESLDWLKDCDVTWLYGPLRTRSDRSLRIRSCSPASSTLIPKSNFLLKKPILKKRNTSEIMLQRSVLASPGTGEEKHIHFNEQVEQCISLEMKGGKDEEPDSYAIQDYDSSDSNDGAIMMKRTNSKWGLPLISSRQGKPRANSSADSKTIAVLPSTTLKRGGKALPPLEIAVKHNNEQPLSVVTGCKETIVVTREGLQNLHTPKSSSSINSCLSSMPTKKTKTSWPRKVHFGK